MSRPASWLANGTVPGKNEQPSPCGQILNEAAKRTTMIAAPWYLPAGGIVLVIEGEFCWNPQHRVAGPG
jgi:hypothetical protein